MGNFIIKNTITTDNSFAKAGFLLYLPQYLSCYILESSSSFAMAATGMSHAPLGHEIYTQANTMEKIKNGDPVLYKNLKGTIYGKPRENKYKGLLYIVKIGDDYFKASANELTLNAEELPTNEFQLLSQQERR
ncbi:MAG: hypothetical protein WD824_05365 [Cyclobacteriaceae bacterium]